MKPEQLQQWREDYYTWQKEKRYDAGKENVEWLAYLAARSKAQEEIADMNKHFSDLNEYQRGLEKEINQLKERDELIKEARNVCKLVKEESSYGLIYANRFLEKTKNIAAQADI